MMENTARWTVIIVDDSDSCTTTLGIALEGMERMRLVFCRRAEDALSRIELDVGASCSALITDLHLPGMDGFELVRRVRKLRPAGSFPILVLSGDSDPGTPGQVGLLGADAYYRKPYSPAEVRATLEKLLDETEDPRLTV
jgi:DNA-binding response OmpR family regulator